MDSTVMASCFVSEFRMSWTVTWCWGGSPKAGSVIQQMPFVPNYLPECHLAAQTNDNADHRAHNSACKTPTGSHLILKSSIKGACLAQGVAEVAGTEYRVASHAIGALRTSSTTSSHTSCFVWLVAISRRRPATSWTMAQSLHSASVADSQGAAYSTDVDSHSGMPCFSFSDV